MLNQSEMLSPGMNYEQITCKKFAVISFPDEEETLYVVASSWLEKAESSDFYNCYWPPYKGDSRIKTAVLEDEIPSFNWSNSKARLITQCSTYESAEEMLRVIDTISTHRSEMFFQKKYKLIQNENFLKDLRIGACSVPSFQGSFNSMSINPDATQSGPFIISIASNANENYLHNSTSITHTSVQNSRKDNLSTHKKGDISRLSLLSTTSNGEVLDEVNTENESCGSSSAMCCGRTAHTSSINFELRVLKTLSEMKGQIIEYSNQLSEFSKQLTNVSKEIFESKENFPPFINDTLKDVFPFRSAEDLQQFDTKLKDKNFKKKVIRHFSIVGGSSVAKCTLHLLNFVMKPSAAVEYSWFGKKERKRAFCCLELVDAIQEAVRIHFKNATNQEIKKIAQDWLRHAREKLVRSSKARSQNATVLSN